MARKRKQIEPEQYFDETGQLRFVSVETCEEMRNGEATQVEVRGFWSGEPHKSHFFALPEVPDKRGIKPSLKRRVGEEAESLAKIREALKHPIAPDADTVRKHRIPPSERRSPFKRGTLKWYRNELALAHDRIWSLEDQRDRLVAENGELSKIVLDTIQAPADHAGKNTGSRSSKYEQEYPKWSEIALDVLHRSGSYGLTDKQVVSKVANWLGIRVDRRVLNTWWTNEGPRIRAEAQRRWPSPTKLFGSLKTAR